MSKTIKHIALALSCLFTFSQTQAQDALLKGRVQELKNEVLLSGIKVENQTQHETVFSDSRGAFIIRAKKGDVVCFSGTNYAPDTVYIADFKYLVISLEPKINQLQEVNVKTTEAHLGNLSAAPNTGPLGSKTIVYQKDEGPDKRNGGLKLKLFDSHSDEKKREKLRKLEEGDAQYHEIVMVFNEENLKKYVPLRGQELKNFILKYTPDADTYYSGKFNLASYLNESYKEFMTIPEDKRKSTTYFQLDGDGN
ncbi:hypothetical protein [Mucilaginibacter sp. dw_454]|uniref:hypothetical protein n=1 Tax=Mucilaginibacter sp. dw_454 TaxID=2720079 RepID=UPI001BD37D3D|nr:hypothetical protein [Mucilaginibacter sp. dw_454]